jgi:type IV secretory pathway VirJ component
MAKKKLKTENTSTLTTKDTKISESDSAHIDESALFERVAGIIENRKSRARAYANREIVLMYWEVGRYLNSVVLDYKRGEYGKAILATLSQELQKKYGNSFEYTKITRMIKFAELFYDEEIVATLSQHLSWSHIVELLPLKTQEARLYYANDVAGILSKYPTKQLREYDEKISE